MVVTREPVREKYTLVTVRQFPRCRIHGILWSFYFSEGSFSQCRLFSFWSFVRVHLYKIVAFADTELILIGEESEIQDSILKIGKSILAMIIFILEPVFSFTILRFLYYVEETFLFNLKYVRWVKSFSLEQMRLEPVLIISELKL